MTISIIVCGGRHWNDREKTFRALDTLNEVARIVSIIEGDATGADRHAEDWANEHGVRVIKCPVREEDWNRLGRAAGPLRNQKMLIHLLESNSAKIGVVAMPGGRGTADMVRQAKGSGVKVWHPYPRWSARGV